MFGISLWHVLEDISLASIHTHESQRSGYEVGDFFVILLLEFFKGGSKFHILVSEDQITLNFREVFIQRLQSHLILMFKGFVELVVEMVDPETTLLDISGLGDGLNDLPDLGQVLLPEVLVLQNVHIHQLNQHVHYVEMYFPESSIF